MLNAEFSRRVRIEDKKTLTSRAAPMTLGGVRFGFTSEWDGPSRLSPSAEDRYQLSRDTPGSADYEPSEPCVELVNEHSSVP